MDEPKISLSRNDTLMPARLTEFTPVSTSAAVNATHRDARQTNSAPTVGSTKCGSPEIVEGFSMLLLG